MRLPAVAMAFLAVVLPSASSARPLVEGLDHIPVAVADLDRASADFARLGFIIKPGRPHDDGLRNRHVKFSNGGGIELISVASPSDALARDYEAWLKGGDGPAFWSLYAPDLGALALYLASLKLAPDNQGHLVTISQAALPHRLFFADRLRSPTDGVAYWAHPNTAYRLAGIWLAGTDDDVSLLSSLGVERSDHDRCSPFDKRAAVFMLPGEGDAVMVAPGVGRSQERSVIGVTVLVKSLASARRILDANGVSYTRNEDCRKWSLWIAPAYAHNLWLELHEPIPDQAVEMSGMEHEVP